MRILYWHHDRSLVSLAEGCLALTPKVSLLGEREIYLDLAPTLKLFGGETSLLSRLEKLKEFFGVHPQQVLTDRPEWARAFALGEDVMFPPRQSFEMLMGLPIERLTYCGDPTQLEKERKERESLVAFMRRVGLKIISDFTKLNATAVGRRFGKLGMLLRDWVAGTRELALPVFQPQENIKEFLDTEDVESVDSLLLMLRAVFVRMESRLHGRNQLARQLKLTFYLESGVRHELLKLSEPMRDAVVLTKFLQGYLNEPRWDTPLKSLEIEVTDAITVNPGQLSLFDTTENRFGDLAIYVARLRNRLGEHNVGFAELQESYLPERSWKNVYPPAPNQKFTQKVQMGRPFPALRPPLLYSPPRPYHPSRNARLIPSENLSSEWWEGKGARRYFIAQTQSGEKLWIFWDSQSHEWYLHGTFC